MPDSSLGERGREQEGEREREGGRDARPFDKFSLET